jgi:hypothetical protein
MSKNKNSLKNFNFFVSSYGPRRITPNITNGQQDIYYQRDIN